MSATTPTAAEMERLRLRRQQDADLRSKQTDQQEADRLETQGQRVETSDGKLAVPRTAEEESILKGAPRAFRNREEEDLYLQQYQARTPAEQAAYDHQREERRRAKQVEYDPRIHGAGTVTPVEPQSVREMFKYYLSLEARVRQLENLSAGVDVYDGQNYVAPIDRPPYRPPNPPVPLDNNLMPVVQPARPNPTARDNPLTPASTPVRLSTNQPAAVADVEESGGTQSEHVARPSPFTPHK